MPYKSQPFDYEPVRKRRAGSVPRGGWEDGEEDPFAVSRRASASASRFDEDAADWTAPAVDSQAPSQLSQAPQEDSAGPLASSSLFMEEGVTSVTAPAGVVARPGGRERGLVRRGHALSFAGLFLFTTLLYFRPYDLSAALSFLSTAAFWVAVCTLILFAPAQLVLEGNLTARPREVNLVLLFCLAGLLSVPLAFDPYEAWTVFFGFLKVVLMFIVMVNVVRTQRRLRLLMLLALCASWVVSLGVLNDYRQGNLKVSGERVAGVLGGLLENPNELALFLVIMMPISAGLMMSTRGLMRRALYGASALLMMLAIVLTFSRGGFIGLVCTMSMLLWKMGRRHRLSVAALALLVCGVLLALMPGILIGRFASIFDTSADISAGASAISRRDLLFRSILIALRHPLLGIGMGGFHNFSNQNQVTHNSYTQVASEMGLAATIIYTMFIVTPLRRLRRIEREIFDERRGSRFYYLALGLQASIVGYMVCSFFDSVAYQYYLYYLVGYAVCLHRMYEVAREGRATKGRGAGLLNDEDEWRRESVAASSALEAQGAFRAGYSS